VFLRPVVLRSADAAWDVTASRSASINQPDYYASSYPLQTHRDWVKNAVHLRRLNELHRRVKTLENTINYPENKE